MWGSGVRAVAWGGRLLLFYSFFLPWYHAYLAGRVSPFHSLFCSLDHPEFPAITSFLQQNPYLPRCPRNRLQRSGTNVWNYIKIKMYELSDNFLGSDKKEITIGILIFEYFGWFCICIGTLINSSRVTTVGVGLMVFTVGFYSQPCTFDNLLPGFWTCIIGLIFIEIAQCCDHFIDGV